MPITTYTLKTIDPIIKVYYKDVTSLSNGVETALCRIDVTDSDSPQEAIEAVRESIEGSVFFEPILAVIQGARYE